MRDGTYQSIETLAEANHLHSKVVSPGTSIGVPFGADRPSHKLLIVSSYRLRENRWIRALDQIHSRWRVFTWDVPVQDVNVTNLGTSAVLRTLSVPMGVNVFAMFHARTITTTTSSAVATIYADPALTDTAPDFNNSQQIPNTTISPYANLRIRTNVSAQIRMRSNFPDSTVTQFLETDGWVDTRGK